MGRAEFTPAPMGAAEAGKPLPHAPGAFRFRAVGFVACPSLVGLAELPAGSVNETHVSQSVRDQCIETGFNVGGIDMAVVLAVSAVVFSPNEGALTAMARADHLLRGGNV
jgi:hypothetical protein